MYETGDIVVVKDDRPLAYYRVLEGNNPAEGDEEVRILYIEETDEGYDHCELARNLIYISPEECKKRGILVPVSMKVEEEGETIVVHPKTRRVTAGCWNISFKEALAIADFIKAQIAKVPLPPARKKAAKKTKKKATKRKA